MIRNDSAAHLGRARRFLVEARGSSTVQQAVFIALIVGGSFLALDGLGLVANKTFGTASHQLASQGHPPANGPLIASAAATRAQVTETPPATASPAPMSLRLVVLLIACPLGALCWYFLYRRQREPEASDDELLPSAKVDSEIERDLIFDKRHNLLRLFNADLGMLMTSRITVRQVMSEKVCTITPNTPIDEIRDIIEKKKFRHVLVCEKNGRLTGLITHRCLENPTGTTAAEIMRRDPITVEPTSLLNATITQLIKQRLYCLPVVEEGKLVGVITTTDILMAMQCTLHALQKSANEAIADLPPGTVPGFMLAAGQFDDYGAALDAASREDLAAAALSN